MSDPSNLLEGAANTGLNMLLPGDSWFLFLVEVGGMRGVGGVAEAAPPETKRKNQKGSANAYLTDPLNVFFRTLIRMHHFDFAHKKIPQRKHKAPHLG